MKKILDYLGELGLSESEAKIYEGLLEHGPSSITDLSNKIKMNRITTHFNVKSLVQKGLVTHLKEGRKKELKAESPDTLQYLIEQKELETHKLRDSFPDFLTSLESILPDKDSQNKFDVKHYQGKNGVRAIYREVLKSHELRSFVNINQIFKIFPENPQLFPENVEKGHLTMWEIIENSPESRKYVQDIDPEKYKFKFFPKTWDQTKFFDYMIFNNNVAIITTENNEPYGILLSNKNIYENSKFIFDLVWNILK